MKSKAFLLTLLLALPAAAQNAPSEVGQLFRALEASGCSFNRNGSWYSASEASAHLHRKYDYLTRKGLAGTAESFIDLAASKSSMSGRPYLVRCGSGTPVESRAWFLGKLAELRRAPAQH